MVQSNHDLPKVDSVEDRVREGRRILRDQILIELAHKIFYGVKSGYESRNTAEIDSDLAAVYGGAKAWLYLHECDKKPGEVEEK